MSTNIESFLYRNMGTHGVVELRIAGDSIDLTVAPFDDLENTFAVRFQRCRLRYMDSSYSDASDDWTMPWDIIGFDNDPHGDQWNFCLHSAVIELVFQANWPIQLPISQKNRA
jgi:hypothetical protein